MRAALLISLLSGPAVWFGLMFLSGRSEGWDSPFYFNVGMPLLAAGAAVSGYLQPRHAWRWGVLPMATQAIINVATHPNGGLLPLGMLLFGFLSLPLMACAWVGARFRRSAPG